jgi:hypothetical protein
MRTGTYLATFTPGTREPHPFTIPDRSADSRAALDRAAYKQASKWAGFSELFRRTDTGFVRVG